MILPLEQQVCSLELAKRLKELGFEQESLFFYNSKTNEIQQGFTSHTDCKGIHHWSISAFTVAELGKMLPDSVVDKQSNSWVSGRDERFFCAYETPISSICHKYANTEADARAKMLIYLKENNLL